MPIIFGNFYQEAYKLGGRKTEKAFPKLEALILAPTQGEHNVSLVNALVDVTAVTEGDLLGTWQQCVRGLIACCAQQNR